MSMVTTCPACHTTFRVTAEQLNARQGEVRCGHCQSIFNAFDSLAPASDTPPAKPVAAPAADSALTAPAAPQPIVEQSASLAQEEPALSGQPEVPAEPVLPDDTAPASIITEEIELTLPPGAEPATEMLAPENSVPAKAADEASTLPPIEIEFDLDSPDTIGELELASLDAATEAPQEELLHTGTPPEITDPPEAEITTLAPPPGAPASQAEEAAQTDTAAFTSTYIPNTIPERKRHTGLWLLANFLLLLLLCLQAGYYWRSQIAVLYPQSRPYLQQTCNVLGCSLPLPRDLGMLDIASSELQALPDHPNIIQLSLVLRNQADIPQALPTLELTFTSSDDKAIGRRQLPPVEYLRDTRRKIADGFAPHSEIPLKLYVDTGKLQPAGYRLLLL